MLKFEKKDDVRDAIDEIKFYVTKSQFAAKLDNGPSALRKRHQYLLKGSPVKSERDLYIFRNSPLVETE